MSETVTHYTDLSACLSIIKNNEFWLTNCQDTNDIMELEVINEELAKNLSTDVTEVKVIRDILELSDRAFQPFKEHTYLMSFCSKPEDNSSVAKDGLLSMWNRYARNEVAIELNKTRLVQLCSDDVRSKNLTNVVLENVEYGAGKKWENDYCVIFKKTIPEPLSFKFNEEGLRTLGQFEMVKKYVLMRFLTKHKGFHEEQESRILLVDNPERIMFPPKFRINSNGTQSKYIVFKNLHFKSCIQRILIGPNPRKEYIEQELINLKKSGDLPDSVEIAFSEIPYRE
jgi:hypothetical protein